MKLNKIIVFLLIIILVLLAVIGFKKMSNKDNSKKVKVLDEISGYNYKLDSSKNSLYKSEFNNLVKVLKKDKVNEEEYAKSISKLFIIDFYSLNDKLTKNDVGGVEFIHSEAKEGFIAKAKDTLYKYIESNLYGNRNQKLPSVKDVKVNKIQNISYEYVDNNDDGAFEVELSWEYKNNDNYQKEATLILVHEDKKLSIVELK